MINVLGSANLDLIGTVSRIPSPGETVPGGAFSTGGAVVAVVLAALAGLLGLVQLRALRRGSAES